MTRLGGLAWLRSTDRATVPYGVNRSYLHPSPAEDERKNEVVNETNEAWLASVQDVLHDGAELRQEHRAHAPRDATTRELLCHHVVVPMVQPLVTVAKRRLGYRFACAEAASILSGDNRVSQVSQYAPHVATFSDDGYAFNGHYGVKFVEQESWVAAQLTKDVRTRQAVMNLWRERPGDTRDVPCTLSLQWLIREGRLNCIATMRSSDVHLGLPYDFLTFSAMSAHLGLRMRYARRADKVEVELGDLHVIAGSRHLYKIDWPAAQACLDDPTPAFDCAPLNLAEFDGPDDLVEHLWTLARRTEPVKRGWLKETLGETPSIADDSVKT